MDDNKAQYSSKIKNSEKFKNSGNNEQYNTKAKKKKIIIAIVVVILVLAGVALCFFLRGDDEPADKGAIVISKDSRTGSEMNDRVAAGMIAVKMTGVWTFEDGNSAGDGYVANSQHNDAPLRILVQLSDTGETVLEVDSIPVGSCVENFKLSQDLAPGTYPAIVTHSTLDDAGNITNSVKTEIQIVVEK